MNCRIPKRAIKKEFFERHVTFYAKDFIVYIEYDRYSKKRRY